MDRKVIAVWLSTVMVLSFLVVIIEIAPTVRATVINVGGTGPGNFTTIQEGVDAAFDEDTVFVYNGTYYENVIVDKTINLTGEGMNNTIIDGGGSGIVVRINADRVDITGFTVINGNYGIYLDSSFKSNVTGNNASNCWVGVFLAFSNSNIIRDNNVSNNWDGIHLFLGGGNTIIGNNVSNNGDGIYLDNSDNNNITGNNISNNDYGIFSDRSKGNNIIDNKIDLNNYYGIFLESSNATNVSGNAMIRNGIFIRGNLLGNWNTHEIDSTNTVNGKAVEYWKNQTSGIIPAGAGEVILANCTNVNVEYQDLTSGSVGVELGFSSNNSITGNNASFNTIYGIYLYSSNGNNITGNNASNSSRYGIYLYYSDGNNITGNNASSNNDNGIHISDSDGNTVKSNVASLNNWYGIFFDSSDRNNITSNNASFNDNGITLHFSSNCNITDNSVSNNDYGITIESSPDNNLSSNNVSDNWFGTRLESSTNISLSKNNFVNDGVYISGFYLDEYNTHTIPVNNLVNGKPLRYYKDTNGMIIDGGSITAGEIILVNCSDMDVIDFKIDNTDIAIEAAFITNSTISGNDVSSNEIEGISLWYSSNITITHNNVSDINYPEIPMMMIYNGILIFESNNNNVSNNNVSDNGGSGILILASSNNTISNNNVSNNTAFGIIIYEFASNNSVSNNIVLNSEYGIIVSSFSNDTIINNNNVSWNNNTGIAIVVSCSNNTIMGNNITNNGLGINLANSYDNRIFHNNIIANTNQSWDFTINGNQWDNGYPSGGNYWSDYAGIDNFRGSNQDQPGIDSIGDTNYSIDLDSIDNYPLMAPYPYEPLENSTILKQGWNLISIPLIQIDQNLTKVLEMIDGWYDAVQWYNNSDLNDPWKHNKIGKPYGNDLTKINESMGFWVHVTEPGDTIFLYNGTQPTENQTITLYPGWNQVGYPSKSVYNRTEGLNTVNFGSQVDKIQWYDAGTQTWQEMGPDDYFVPTRGYWIHATTECQWEVPL